MWKGERYIVSHSEFTIQNSIVILVINHLQSLNNRQIIEQFIANIYPLDENEWEVPEELQKEHTYILYNEFTLNKFWLRTWIEITHYPEAEQQRIITTLKDNPALFSDVIVVKNRDENK
jgi:hypothetical protein